MLDRLGLELNALKQELKEKLDQLKMEFELKIEDIRSKLEEHQTSQYEEEVSYDDFEIGDENFPAAAGTFRVTLALIRCENGALDEARALLKVADAQLRGLYAFQLAKLLCARAQVEQLAGDAAAAAAALSEAETIAADIKAGPDSELRQDLTKARTALAA